MSDDLYHYLRSALSNEPHPTTVWASGNDNTWGNLKHGFTGITPYFSKLSERGATWVSSPSMQSLEIMFNIDHPFSFCLCSVYHMFFYSSQPLCEGFVQLS